MNEIGEIPPHIACLSLGEREVYFRDELGRVRAELLQRITQEDPLHVGTRELILNLQRECAYLREQLGQAPADDQVSNPSHYNSHPSGVECIDIIEHMPLNVGNAIKYLWRAGIKDGAPTEQDYRKAIWFITREIKRIGGGK